MKIYTLLSLLLLSYLLYGCGQTGPLYLPGTPPPIHTDSHEKQSQLPETKVVEPSKETTKSTSSHNQ
jgi:predicted small lipoprotein YifL